MSTQLASNVRVLRRPASAKTPAGNRLHVNWPANISAGPDHTDCTVVNISRTGACLSLAHVADAVPLWLNVGKMATISAMIVWREGNCVGVRFPKEQSWVEETSEQRFNPAAWLRNDLA